ncbi:MULTISPECIES: MFS transporter [Actinomadura]|uniref:MFS transporter n=1 Tax=Actinomadura litoris TaxID=2678616 RepID=A0A7K1KVY3_9ACTN|nr:MULTISPECIES: MFS transporter [Actinomadura]MBT2211432.1 MFS transporter [Actinomadura sp. NEAU-AAG7]MUN36350.1 MFS transporter [Actinomadura litoris]
MRSVRPRRDLALVATACGLSTLGTTAAFLAMVLHLREAGAGWVTALLLAEISPVILMAPVAGAIVDRLEARAVLIWASAGQAVVSVALSLVDAPAAVVGLVALLGAQAAVERPAAAVLVPHITGEDGATRGYARLGTGRALGGIIGPAVGGFAGAAGGTRAALLLNAASFLVLAIAMTTVGARRRPHREAAPAGGGRGFARAGFRVVLGDPVLRFAIPLTALAAGIALADNVAAPYRFTDDLGAGPVGFGVYEALYSVCELVGIQVFALEAGRGREEGLLGAGNLMLGLGVLGIGLAATYPLALAAAVVGGVGNGMSNAGEGAVIRRCTPEATRGRAFAASGSLIQAASVAGAAAGAPAVAALGPAATMVVSGALASAVASAGVVVALRRTRETAVTDHLVHDEAR